MRKILDNTKIAATALHSIEAFHNHIVNEVEAAVAANQYVIVGMRQNPVVSKAIKALADKNLTFKYLEYGSYFSKWKQRLALKLWSGWPTFPMVFVEGKLIGGGAELKAHLAGKNQAQ